MTKEGLPFQNLVSEQPGHISGYPAVTRLYSGHTNNGAYFDSQLVASYFNGVNYIFQGLSMKGHEQARRQLRHAMNTWYYPGAGSSDHVSNNQQGGLPLGSGNSGHTPYDNDPYGNTQQHANTPSPGGSPQDNIAWYYSLRQQKKRSGSSGNSGNYRSKGACWAWGLWKNPARGEVIILPDGRIDFGNNMIKKWELIDPLYISVNLPDGSTQIWTHPDWSHKKITKANQPNSDPVMYRKKHKMYYKGKLFVGCTGNND
ncbi:hypothetical protein [Desulfovibrio sp. JC022]|uniref:hypothetical protein n=1 Tax=Desulfovibrio sp. JC022 TaxID=2593642 RepID=UPI0013D8DA74|nr:hypothetical protein [Desulfovibrio sp. JC022]NDV23666.1 hypothetical protein [Desulfovibrio sp. JC022]